jgi:hypothetical protein
VICIAWTKERKDQISSANIIARMIYHQCACGPLLSLAFEVSPTKALPHYAFSTFDLKDERHRNYLLNVFNSGQIHLIFLADSDQLARTYEIPADRCQKMSKMYATAIADLQKFPTERYDFDRALREFEQSIRIVDYFACAVPDWDMERLIASSRTNAKNVSPEVKAKAAQLVHEFFGVFRPRYDTFFSEQIGKVPDYNRFFLLVMDLHRRFEGDYEAAVQFCTDIIATHKSKQEIEKLRVPIPFLKLMLKLIDYLKQKPPEDEQTTVARENEFQNIVNRMVTTGPSFEMFRAIPLLFGFEGGRPGRPSRDYSAEYRLKAEGKTWREVAEYHLQNDHETL